MNSSRLVAIISIKITSLPPSLFLTLLYPSGSVVKNPPTVQETQEMWFDP